MSNVIDKINAEFLNKKPFAFKVGDEVKVGVKIREGDKDRIQNFIGQVIARDGDGANETFTVRRISFGVGVEKVFPVHSPFLDHVDVERSPTARRAKLYYLRELRGKKAKLREKQ